jgi:hypothetical protein
MTSKNKAQKVRQPAAPSPTKASRHGLELAALIAEIIGALAVVLSVIYLALQISGNNKLLRNQAYYNFLTLGHSPLQMIVNNKELSETVFACDASPDTVSTADWQRCLNYYFILMNTWEYTYYSNHDKALPIQVWNGADVYFKALFKSAGYRQFWSEYNMAYAQPFHAYAQAAYEVSVRSSPDPASDPQKINP